LNGVLLLLEARGLFLSLPKRKWRALVFYTQLSNMLTVMASLLLMLFGQPAWVTAMRYLSVCMMVMTFFVTACVLVPMGGDPRKLLGSGSGLYHHVLCPVLTTVSYFAFERHAASALIVLPVAVTLLYGLVMLWLNAKHFVDGPYPFFRVHHQSAAATVLWMAALMLAMGGISALVCLAAGPGGGSGTA